MTTIDRISYELGELPDRESYLRAVLEFLPIIIPGDAVAWNAVDEATRTVEIRGRPDTAFGDPEWLTRMSRIDDNPMVRSYLDEPPQVSRPRPRRMSDLISMRGLRNTAAHAELLGPWKINYELTILTARPTPTSGRCWAVTRQIRDFTDAELAIADTAQPLLVTLDRAHSPSSTRVTPHQSDLYGLTRREQQVLQYTADGFTAIQIGHLLRISPKTVRKHQQAVYAKLRSHGRVQAIRTAWTSGLLSPPSP